MTVAVIFTRRRAIGSLLLRTFLWSAYSHCALIDRERGTIIEAAAPRGVRERPLADLLATASHWVSIEIPGDERAACDALRTQIGKGYDWGFLFGFLFRRNWQDANRWGCSEAVAWAVEQSGRRLFRAGAHRITPRDLQLPIFDSA